MLNYAGTPPLAAMADADSRQLIAAGVRLRATESNAAPSAKQITS